MTTKNLPNNVQVINLLRTTASEEFNTRIPVQTKTNIKDTINIIETYPTTKNEFIVQLTNLVGRTIFLSKLYENPLKFFKKGTLEYGKTIEAVFIDLIQGKTFEENFGSGDNEATSLIGTEKPNVEVEYYSENFRNKYKISISNAQLKGALRSERGLSELIQRVLISPLNSAEFDEYLMVKQVLNNVTIKDTTITDYNTITDRKEKASILTETIKTYVNKFRFMSNEFNHQGVNTFSRPEELVVLVTPETKAMIDVNLLSSAFNMDKAEIEGRLVMIDSFTKQDSDSGVVSVDPDTLAIVCDYDLIQFHETENATESFRNPDTLTTNTFFHRWGIMSGSGFVNAIKIKKPTV